MRLDKYLKTSRIIKRRTVANEACSKGRVFINGKPSKPGSEVKIGDIIGVQFGDTMRKYEVLQISENVSKDDAPLMYRIIE